MIRKSLVLLLLLLGVGPARAQPAGGINFREPRRAYVALEVRGRIYQLERSLRAQSPKLGLQATLRLDQNFLAALALLPPHARPQLRNLKFYVMQGPSAPGGGQNNGLEYFRAGSPVFWNNIDANWSHCIVCYCAQNYTLLSSLWARKAVLHELAHAYGLTNYPESQIDLRAAWEHAKQAGLYRNVTDDEGKQHKEAYALTNPLEYFAELSVMYFARCNYPPFDRASLRRYDPQGYAMIEKLWKL